MPGYARWLCAVQHRSGILLMYRRDDGKYQGASEEGALMTFDSRLCEIAFVTLGRGSRLRHAYRAYLWRHARGLIDHSHRDETKTAVADFCSAIHPTMAARSRPQDAEPVISRDLSDGEHSA